MEKKWPRFFVLQSIRSKVNLRCFQREGNSYGSLVFEEEITTPYVKFQVEKSKKYTCYVHIKSCYNNKYLRRNQQYDDLIVAGAKEPEEDMQKWACTLFQPVYSDDNDDIVKEVRLLLVQPNSTSFWATNVSTLLLGRPEGPDCYPSTFRVIDWEEVVIFPKLVAFKGDNGKYLHPRADDERYLELEFSASDKRDSTVKHEFFTTSDGHVRIKCLNNGKFWRQSSNWIWADSNDNSSNNNDTLFWPVKISNNVVALRNAGNHNFCSRLANDCLNAALSSISQEAYLEVEEIVISRQIYDVKFRFDDAVIYNQTVETMDQSGIINMGDQPLEQEVVFSKETTQSNNWNAGVSLQVGIEFNCSAGIPIIGETDIKVSSSFEGKYEWGKTVETKSNFQNSYKIVAPPMTKVTAYLLATKGSYSIPYSYTQRDVLPSGKHEVSHKDDGVFTGYGCHNFFVEVKQEKFMH